MNEKTSINSIYPNLWAPTAGLLQIYQIKFKSRSDWYSLHWSEAELCQYCCQWMEKVSPCLCSHSGQTLKAILLQTVKKWTTEWNVFQGV